MESPYIVFYSLYLKCKGTYQEKIENIKQYLEKESTKYNIDIIHTSDKIEFKLKEYNISLIKINNTWNIVFSDHGNLVASYFMVMMYQFFKYIYNLMREDMINKIEYIPSIGNNSEAEYQILYLFFKEIFDFNFEYIKESNKKIIKNKLTKNSKLN